MADISHFAELGWYDWIKFFDTFTGYPEPKEVLGRGLGPAIDIAPAMMSKVLRSNGQVIYTSTYHLLTDDEMADPTETKLRAEFDMAITTKLGSPLTDSNLRSDDIDAETPIYEFYEDDQTPSDCLPEVDDVTLEDADFYIGAEVSLPIGGMLLGSTIKHCARNIDGNLTGKADKNPMLDSRTYKVEFEHGRTVEFSANAIAENMFTQCIPEGNQYLVLDLIIDHKIESSAIKEGTDTLLLMVKSTTRKQ